MSIADPQSIHEALDAHLLSVDLAAETEIWYRRVVGNFCAWCGTSDVPRADLTAERVSEYLRAKQREGRSPHYVKSLRGGLLAVLAPWVDQRNVRTIRPPKLDPDSWLPEEVDLLIDRVDTLPEYKRPYYSRIIGYGFYTGLSKVDLHLLERRHFTRAGVLITRRHRTGKLVVVEVPIWLLRGMPMSGRFFPRLWSDEQFRRDFGRIVQAAGLTGTFKQLRKTSGTEADLQNPGRGHIHLGNTRKVFEAHYLNNRRVHREPIRLKLPARDRS